MKKRSGKTSQTALDEKRKTSFHHLLLGGIARFWPLALLAPILIYVYTASLAAGLLASFAVNSLLTILFYREDKFLAQNNYWRIPEKYLHIWEFLCGWPGALYARHAFRHKRIKGSFIAIFWLCAFANIAVLILFFYCCA